MIILLSDINKLHLVRPRSVITFLHLEKINTADVDYLVVKKMEACCSFKTIVGSSCGFHAKDRKRQTEIVPLLSCTKDITNHLSTLSFSGPENEIDLILSRASLFGKSDESIKSMTICPNHRAKLGISWTRGGGTRCRVPQTISGHGKSKGSWPKGERGLGKQESYVMLCNTGVFVPPGSGRFSKDSLHFIMCMSLDNLRAARHFTINYLSIFSPLMHILDKLCQEFARNADI